MSNKLSNKKRKAKTTVANFVMQAPGKGGGKRQKFKVMLPVIVNDIVDNMEDHPLVNVSGVVNWHPSFEPEELPTDEDIFTVDTATDLKTYLEANYLRLWTNSQVSVGTVDMKVTPVDTGTVLARLEQVTKRYDAIEMMPHYPARRNLYYIKHEKDIKNGSGHHLKELMEMMNPETDLDRDLIKAMFLTPMWGGDPGARPMFVITTDHGRGVGKSTTVEALAEIYGGMTQIDVGDDTKDIGSKVKRALGTVSEIAKRPVFMDNIKGRLDSEVIESMITARELAVDRMYHGSIQPPNYKTFILTNNNAQLSTDLAERSIVIKIGPKNHSRGGADYLKKLFTFIEENRLSLVEDILATLRGPNQCKIPDTMNDRWAAWAGGVLSKFHNGEDMYRLIQKRRASVDAEAAEAFDIIHELEILLKSNGIPDPSSVSVCIPTDKVVEMVRKYKGWSTLTPKGMWDLLAPLESSEAFKTAQVRKGREVGSGCRGLVWGKPKGMRGEPWDDVVNKKNPSFGVSGGSTKNANACKYCGNDPCDNSTISCLS